MVALLQFSSRRERSGRRLPTRPLTRTHFAEPEKRRHPIDARKQGDPVAELEKREPEKRTQEETSNGRYGNRPFHLAVKEWPRSITKRRTVHDYFTNSRGGSK